MQYFFSYFLHWTVGELIGRGPCLGWLNATLLHFSIDGAFVSIWYVSQPRLLILRMKGQLYSGVGSAATASVLLHQLFEIIRFVFVQYSKRFQIQLISRINDKNLVFSVFMKQNPNNASRSPSWKCSSTFRTRRHHFVLSHNITNVPPP